VVISSSPGALRRYVLESPSPGTVIDLGCGLTPHPSATTIVDLYRMPGGFVGEKIHRDVCDFIWSFNYPRGYFDLAFCSYVLEDVAYPFGVLRTMCEIAKKVLVGVPHWTYEAGIREVRPDWDPVSGWPHHRWLFGLNKGIFEFMAKYSWFGVGEYDYTQQYIHIEADSDQFKFADITYDYPGPSKRDDLLLWLKERWE